MKDFLGNNLEVGDIVVMMRPNYREFMKAKIVRFTKCFVIVTYEEKYGPNREFVSHYEIKQDPCQLIKIPSYPKD
ncbi:hypothetical protein b3_0149 [Synechococcus phage B3]|nr:hypothetical protein b3_0149 [Synechococcus phage B3]QGT54763.1 hypothetical protein b23_0148 [Synechococcus phage B23]